MAELEGVLRRYPWFAIGRKALYTHLINEGRGRSVDLIKRVAPYLYSTEELVKSVRRGVIVREEEPKVAPVAVAQEKEREIYIVGGDYFGVNDYKEVKAQEGNIFDTLKALPLSDPDIKVKVDKSNDQFSDDEYCTETLAKIYVDQGCFKRALEVYDKLILLYPEKSTYFAALKEEIKKQL